MISVVVLAPGGDLEGSLAAIQGLAGAIRDQPEALVFLDAGALTHHRRVWSELERLNLPAQVRILEPTFVVVLDDVAQRLL